MASSLQEMALELERQPEALESYAMKGLPQLPRGSILVGAGDSYAAALAGFYASNGRCIAIDPYSLAADPSIAEGRDVVFISVSGRTSSNLVAARSVSRLARKTAALTAVEDSPLAKSVSTVFGLPMSHSPRTSGMMSFSMSAFAVLNLVGLDTRCDFRRVFAASKRDSAMLSLGANTTYLLGNSLAYPAAVYASAKVYELLGAKAHSELLEEFSHMELFSLERSDMVNIFADFDPAAMSRNLARRLAKARFRCVVIPGRGSSVPERFFHCVFVSQLWSLDQARRAGLNQPAFLSGGRISISDSIIY